MFVRRSIAQLTNPTDDDNTQKIKGCPPVWSVFGLAGGCGRYTRNCECLSATFPTLNVGLLEPSLAHDQIRLNIWLAIKINNEPWLTFTGWKIICQQPLGFARENQIPPSLRGYDQCLERFSRNIILGKAHHAVHPRTRWLNWVDELLTHETSVAKIKANTRTILNLLNYFGRNDTLTNEYSLRPKWSYKN